MLLMDLLCRSENIEREHLALVAVHRELPGHLQNLLGGGIGGGLPGLGVKPWLAPTSGIGFWPPPISSLSSLTMSAMATTPSAICEFCSRIFSIRSMSGFI